MRARRVKKRRQTRRVSNAHNAQKRIMQEGT